MPLIARRHARLELGIVVNESSELGHIDAPIFGQTHQESLERRRRNISSTNPKKATGGRRVLVHTAEGVRAAVVVS